MRRGLKAVTVAVALATAGAAAAEPRDWGPAAEVRQLVQAQLSPDPAATYRAFTARKLYFGAFAVNPADGAASFWRNVPSLGDAVAMALADCQRLSTKGKCEIYAVMVPRGFPKGTLQGSGLAQDAAKAYRGDYLRRAQTDGYAAFAASGVGDLGYAWGHASKQEATEAATLQCLSGMAETLADYQPGQRRVIQRQGANDCEVVDVRGP